MKELENLKELYLEEIKKINKKGELSPADSEAAKKCLEAIAKIDEICCDYEDDEGYSERSYQRHSYGRNGYSQMYPAQYSPMYRQSMMPDVMRNDYQMNDRYSERRGRDSMGRYTSRSHGETVDHMIRELEDMRLDAPDEKTRMAIEHTIQKLEAY